MLSERAVEGHSGQPLMATDVGASRATTLLLCEPLVTPLSYLLATPLSAPWSTPLSALLMLVSLTQQVSGATSGSETSS